jgi:dihydroflavonol-4-reductase
MQALVTGGSGFIGSEVINQLIKQGITVRALLRKTSPQENLKGLSFETVVGDLSDFESLKRAVDGVDYVFHLAGAVAAASREAFFAHNAKGTDNLARACAEVNPGLKRFVYVSSLAASGPAQSAIPKTEKDADAPISTYGESKLEGERRLEEWATQAGFGFTVVRPPAVYGPRDKGIFEFIKIVNNGVLPIIPASNGVGEKYYSVIHVDDLVSGIVLAGTTYEQSKKELFFLTGDGVHTWTELMTAMAESLGKRPLRVRLPNFALTGLAGFYTAIGWMLKKQFPLTLDKLNELRPDYWVCSNERAKKMLGFTPKWDLKSGITQAVSWYKEHGWL